MEHIVKEKIVPEYMNRLTIKSVIQKMGFNVSCFEHSTRFSRNNFVWTINKPLEEVDLELLTIYYTDWKVSQVVSSSNGWK